MRASQIVEAIAAGACVATAAGLTWRLRKRIKEHFRGLLIGEEAIVRISGLLETFFNEAAVLWFVFPLLDAIYEANKGRPAISVLDALGIVAATWSAALAFFYFAAFFKKLEKDGEKKLALLSTGKDH